MAQKKKETAKKAANTSAVIDGIVASMVPIPGMDYQMGRFPITQAQWRAVMGGNPSEFKGTEYPVERVSWEDCQRFLKKLNSLPVAKASGMVFCLPTAEEWELASRAGATGDYCKLADGTEITEDTLGEVAWFKDNSDGMTHPVGQKKPNAFGLYDMHGNVFEWNSSARNLFSSPSFVQVPFSGGSWHFPAKDCASCSQQSVWHKEEPSCRRHDIGLRLCAVPKKAPVVSATIIEGIVASVVEEIIASMVPIPGTDFRMGKFPVTQAQWEAVKGKDPDFFRFWGKNVSCFKWEYPVESVLWKDCQAFLKNLNALPATKASGLVFRLPTAEEWELASRAGAVGNYCKLADGTEITEETLGEVAWFRDNSERRTHPVGQKKPNAFGLYDMHGNVNEWTSTEARYGTPGPTTADQYVACGGGCRHSAWRCESSARMVQSTFGGRGGFRLCAGKPSRVRRIPYSATKDAESVVKELVASMLPIPETDYRMSRFPVTQEQWEAVTGLSYDWFETREHPMVKVTYRDCEVFLEKLNTLPAAKASGLFFRLPTAEESEYAARAGATGNFCKLADGTEITEETLGEVAWFKENSDGKTHPVGQKKPNAFGLYDVLGNVWEWTSTSKHGPRVISGGCGDEFRRYALSSQANDIGFRLCASGRAESNDGSASRK